MAIIDYLRKIDQNGLLYRKTIYGEYPSKPGDGGDDCLWLGLLGSCGQDVAARMIYACQAGPGENRPGMFYRNPERRSNDNACGEPFFSRDMSLGVLMALSSKDKYGDARDKARIAWLDYIDNDRWCVARLPKWAGGACILWGYRFAPDDRSQITPGLWALMGRVWESQGWERHREMGRWKGSDGGLWIAECQVAPVGYQLHLQACHAWIKMLIGQSREYYERALSIIYERAPFNLFYKILNQRGVNQDDIDTWARIVDEKCKTPFGHRWCWEVVQDGQYENCCGWDLYFLGLLMLKFGAN